VGSWCSIFGFLCSFWWVELCSIFGFLCSFWWVHGARSLVFYVMFCRSLFVLLSLFSWPVYCLSFFWLPGWYPHTFLTVKKKSKNEREMDQHELSSNLSTTNEMPVNVRWGLTLKALLHCFEWFEFHSNSFLFSPLIHTNCNRWCLGVKLYNYMVYYWYWSYRCGIRYMIELSSVKVFRLVIKLERFPAKLHLELFKT
jgi:hypothetical protein